MSIPPTTQNETPSPFLFSTCVPEKGDWDSSIPVTSEKIGHFVFKNHVPEQPLDLVSSQGFSGWTEIDKCLVCKGGPFATTWEVVLEWGDTGKLETISEVCATCLNTMNNSIVRNKRPDKRW
jgi:hypothetical protein